MRMGGRGGLPRVVSGLPSIGEMRHGDGTWEWSWRGATVGWRYEAQCHSRLLRSTNTLRQITGVEIRSVPLGIARTQRQRRPRRLTGGAGRRRVGSAAEVSGQRVERTVGRFGSCEYVRRRAGGVVNKRGRVGLGTSASGWKGRPGAWKQHEEAEKPRRTRQREGGTRRNLADD